MNLSPIVSKTIPEFVNDDYPLFVQFLKTYYKWIDNTQINSIENVVDIDNTLESFIQYFRKELDIFGIKYKHIDEKIYLKNVKQFYLAKGSEAAYWFLFKILFNTESAIIRPWDYVFIPSIGNWNQDITIFVTIYSGDANKFKQNNLIIIGDDNVEYSIKIKDVVQIRPNIFELYLFTHITGNISVGNSIKNADKSVSGRIVPTIVNISIEYPGKNFNVGEIYDINTNNAYGSKLIVTEVDEDGGIKTVNLLNFGIGYETEFMHVLSPLSLLEKKEIDYNIILNNNFTELMENYTSVNPDDDVDNIIDSGIISKHTYGLTPTDYFLDLSYVGDILRQFEDKIKSTDNNYSFAILRCYIGHTTKYTGYYLNDYSILGQNDYIQDSYYYQIYSYVTSLDKPLKTYKTILENNIHPIGNKLFGLYSPFNDITTNININADIDFVVPYNYFERIIPSETIILNRINHYEDSFECSDEYYYLFNGEFRITPDNIIISDSINIDYIIAIDEDINITETLYSLISQNIEENINISDNIYVSNSINKSYLENVSISDIRNYKLDIVINLAENVVVSEIDNKEGFDLYYNLGYLVRENILVSDTISRIMNIKVTENSINITDTGIVYQNPYVDSEIQYWELFYSESDQSF